MSPETSVVLQCVRTWLSPANDAALRAALARPLDWQSVEREADVHCVLPIVARAVMQHASELVPPEVLLRCKSQLTHIAKKNLMWLQEWQRLLRAFEEAAIPVISFKGPALALTAYGNLALREFHDLDLMVRSDDVLRTRDVMVQDGYALWSPLVSDSDGALLQSRNRQVCFTNKQRSTSVDLHWGALHEMFSFQLAADQLWQAASLERQEGMSFLSLSPDHVLLYLCAHGTKHCWRNLSWLCDVACQLQSHPSMDWEACIELAESTGCALLLKHTPCCWASRS